jgi:hypothetical protein
MYADCIHIGTLNEIDFMYGGRGRAGPEKSEMDPGPVKNVGPHHLINI